MKRASFIVLAGVSLAACSESPNPTEIAATPTFVASAAEENAQVIPGKFIVTLRDDASPVEVAGDHGVRPDFVYRQALNGFAGSVGEAARSGLMRDARVLSIEPDGIMEAVTTQTGATWGIDRVDQAALPLSGTYTYNNTGTGVTAYIIDTCILFSHS
jgi:hypothetical protein